jgi:hypothetical protein
MKVGDMSKETGGSAFPIPHTIIDANHEHFKIGTDGLTIRDYFAGQVIASDDLDFNQTVEEAAKFIGVQTSEYKYYKHYPMVRAKIAYLFADAMLAERSKT